MSEKLQKVPDKPSLSRMRRSRKSYPGKKYLKILSFLFITNKAKALLLALSIMKARATLGVNTPKSENPKHSFNDNGQ